MNVVQEGDFLCRGFKPGLLSYFRVLETKVLFKSNTCDNVDQYTSMCPNEINNMYFKLDFVRILKNEPDLLITMDIMHNSIHIFLNRSLQATVSGLNPNQPPSVRISAVRAVYGFCEHLKATSSTFVLQPYLHTMMEGLLAIATQFSSEVLALCLETMCVVLAVGPASRLTIFVTS